MKLPPLEAAKKIIQSLYPKCDAALLTGSVVRGEHTSTSDLDIIIFDSTLTKCFLFEGFKLGK
jgi:predicted nucleotidyltransferase